MEIGLHALGIGSGARRAVIDAVAGAAEAGGFATLWCGEHVVMVDRASSRYPMRRRRIAVPADADGSTADRAELRPPPRRRRRRRAERIAALHALCREAGRDPAELRTAVALTAAEPADVPELARLGVTQLVVVEVPPEDAAAAEAWTAALAARWIGTPAG